MKKIKKELEDKKKLVLKKELKSYRKLMKSCSLFSKGIITKKGIAASYINSDYSVLLVHLIVTQFFNDMSAPSLAAFLSSFIHDKNSNTERKRVTNTQIRQKLDETLEIGS